MNWKRFGKLLLFPPLGIMIPLVPIAAVFLIFSMVYIGTKTPVSYGAYVLSAYTLTIWCVKLPRLIALLKTLRRENKYARRWFEDTHLRVSISLYGSLIYNTVYAAFQLGLGFYHRSFWFLSMAGYYLSLAVMRFFLVRHTRRHSPGEKMLQELKKYRACGIVFLILNLTLSLMVFFMVYWNRTFHHHEITTITMAAYTFTALTRAIVNIIKYRKYNSPVYSASKVISLAAACVSMLTLETTMLTTFGAETTTLLTRRLLLGFSGGIISLWIIAMAIYMIRRSNQEIKLLQTAKE